MKVVFRLFQILAIFCTLSCFFVEGHEYINSGNCGIRELGRIVGGNAAQHGEFPWMVSIHFNGRHWCGGTIIQQFWILTAAHCVASLDPRRYEIHAGIHKLSTPWHGIPTFAWKKFEVSFIIPHCNYNNTNYDNDIALMRTRLPIVFTESGGYINEICLPRINYDPIGPASVIGWGHTRENGTKSNVLKKVYLRILPRKNCPHWVNENMICAGGEHGKSSCQGDSGGPLMQMDKQGVFWLVGVVSNGVGCGRQNHPIVYANVPKYVRWMDTNMHRYYY